MAAKLQCEICGGKLIGKPGGVFECEYCGMEFSTEWAKAKIQEIKGTVTVEGTVEVTGKVQVEGGSVQVEGAASKESLLKRAKLCYEDGDFEKAGELIEQVLNADPECGEAYLYRASIRLGKKTLNDLVAYFIYRPELLPDDADMKKAYRFADNGVNAWKAEYEKAAAADLAERQRVTPLLEELRRKYADASRMISCGNFHTVGLKRDGTVAAVGYNSSGQCDVSEWRVIAAISCGNYHTVGLKRDGTVVAVGDNDYGQCNVSKWREIAAISCGDRHTVGLKRDGTVVAVGDNDNGRCEVSKWRDIVAISGHGSSTLGLKRDGTLISSSEYFDMDEVSSWRDIVAISCGNYHTVGLKRDGTVVAAGGNYDGQCEINEWRDILAISCGDRHTVGLKRNGTVITTDKCDLSEWHDIVAISCGNYHTGGLKRDGTVVAIGDNPFCKFEVSNWKLFNNIDTLSEELEQTRIESERKAEEARLEAERKAEEERRIAEEKRRARIAELETEKSNLSTELVNLKGLFSGRRRNEIEARLAKNKEELDRLKK